MKYGIVGTGYWGTNHVRVATELQDDGLIDDVIICDVDEQRAADCADTHGVQYTTDYEEMDADAATVATPSPTHEEIATTLLASGTDLLVEKPLALTASAAWNIVETAKTHDRTLGVGHIFRYHPALRELKQRIDDGELGSIKYLHTNRFSFRVPRDTTGVLYSLAVHDIDIYQYLLEQQPERIYCTQDSFIRESIDETTTVTLEYDSVTGVIHSSWQVPVFEKRRDLVVVGSERSAYIDYLENTKLEIHDAEIVADAHTDTDANPDAATDADLDTNANPTAESASASASVANRSLRAQTGGHTVHTVPDREPLKHEIESFVHACRAGHDPLASGSVGARTIELLERAEVSAEQKEVVSAQSSQVATDGR